jgi:hypothetical protein
MNKILKLIGDQIIHLLILMAQQRTHVENIETDVHILQRTSRLKHARRLKYSRQWRQRCPPRSSIGRQSRVGQICCQLYILYATTVSLAQHFWLLLNSSTSVIEMKIRQQCGLSSEFLRHTQKGPGVIKSRPDCSLLDILWTCLAV